MAEGTSRRQFLGVVGAGVLGSTGGYLGTENSEQQGSPESRQSGSLAKTADAVFRGNLRRQGYSPDASVSESASVDWRLSGVNKTDYSAAKASPVEAPDGTIVVPADTGSLYAVTPSGDVRWAAAIDPVPSGIHGTPVVANGTVYVGAYDGAMYAFDLNSGERLWRTKLGGSVGSSPAYYEGVLYVAVEYPAPSGALFALNAASGDVVWEDDRVQHHPHSTLAIDLGANKMVVGANDGYLYAWDFDTREFAWKFNTGRPIKGPVATFDGAVFFGSWDHNVYRVNLNTGEEGWDRSFTTGDLVMSGPGIDTDTGTVYIGSHDQNLYALDAATGEENWSYETEGSIIGCPTVTSEHVLVGSGDTHTYALDKESGEYVWDIYNYGSVSSSPIVADGAIYYAEDADQDSTGGLCRISTGN